MVPDGWQAADLSEVASVIDCKHRTPRYASDGFPIISPGNIRWGELDLDSCRRISTEELQNMMDHCVVRSGDIVMGRNQSVGIAAYVGHKTQFALGQDTILIQPRSISAQYLYFFLSSSIFQRQINKLSNGSTFTRVNLGDIRKLEVISPTLTEQKKIAGILSTWDEAIETTEKLLANAEAQKRGLMQQLLTGKRRLKGFNERWTDTTIGAVWKVTTGQSAPNDPNDFTDDGLPFLRVSCLSDLLDGRPEDEFERVGEATVEKYRLKRFPPGTVVFAKSGMSARLARVYRIQGQAYLVAHLAAIIPNSARGDERFIYRLLQLQPPTDLIQGDGFPSIKTSAIAARPIRLPPLDEQRAVCNLLDQSDEAVGDINRQLLHLRTEKRALMQQLLTGMRRVKV